MPRRRWRGTNTELSSSGSALLERVTQQDSFDEGSIQRFLEQHPCLIPGAFPEGTTSHAPFPGAIITQPSLVGVRERIPDFMWLATDSTTFQPTLIEIESPNKSWWTDNGTQHQKFTQAWEQLQEWRAWFANPVNVQLPYYIQATVDLEQAGRTTPLHAGLRQARRSESKRLAYAKAGAEGRC